MTHKTITVGLTEGKYVLSKGIEGTKAQREATALYVLGFVYDCVCMSMCVCMSECLCVSGSVCVGVSVNVCVCEYVCLCECVSLCMCVCVHVCW